jgi:quinate dehydrogenase
LDTLTPDVCEASNGEFAMQSEITSTMASPPSSTEPTQISYLFGYPIAHSLSPLLHKTIYSALSLPWAYDIYETRSLSDIVQTIRTDPRLFAASVTMPYKVAIIPYLDELTEEAKAIGAVNTVFIKNEDGKRMFWGTNTDCVGIRESFLQEVEGTPYRGKPALVIGGGGTSRAAVYALKKWLGCEKVYMINRDKREVDAVIEECTARGFGENIISVSSIEQAENLEGPGAVVSCVPDSTPMTENEILSRKLIDIMLSKSEKGALLEMCYHPSPNTEISALAKEKGWQVIPGTEAMIHQALEQSRLWTGREMEDLPVEKVKTVIRAAIKEARL